MREVPGSREVARSMPVPSGDLFNQHYAKWCEIARLFRVILRVEKIGAARALTDIEMRFAQSLPKVQQIQRFVSGVTVTGSGVRMRWSNSVCSSRDIGWIVIVISPSVTSTAWMRTGTLPF